MTVFYCTKCCQCIQSISNHFHSELRITGSTVYKLIGNTEYFPVLVVERAIYIMNEFYSLILRAPSKII
ncbi:hypothetical protein HZS_3829 [Henneguya salminicola]|nr:hypothetical protein HZS_3829 [Henneguya salminicola]